jgi:hypothetical protein
MGGNTLLALKALKVVVAGDKGEYVANEQSLARKADAFGKSSRRLASSPCGFFQARSFGNASSSMRKN